MENENKFKQYDIVEYSDYKCSVIGYDKDSLLIELLDKGISTCSIDENVNTYGKLFKEYKIQGSGTYWSVSERECTLIESKEQKPNEHPIFKIGVKVITTCKGDASVTKDFPKSREGNLGEICIITGSDGNYIEMKSCVNGDTILRFIGYVNSIELYEELETKIPDKNNGNTFEDLLTKDGYAFSCKIEGKSTNGIITTENGYVYLCQNENNGEDCSDKKGYKYSYIIVDQNHMEVSISDFILGNKVNNTFFDFRNKRVSEYRGIDWDMDTPKETCAGIPYEELKHKAESSYWEELDAKYKELIAENPCKKLYIRGYDPYIPGEADPISKYLKSVKTKKKTLDLSIKRDSQIKHY